MNEIKKPAKGTNKRQYKASQYTKSSHAELARGEHRNRLGKGGVGKRKGTDIRVQGGEGNKHHRQSKNRPK